RGRSSTGERSIKEGGAPQESEAFNRAELHRRAKHQGGGPRVSTRVLTGAEAVAWELGDLYAGPDDPRLDTDISQALADARAFRERYRGDVADLDAPGLAEAVAELERIQSVFVRAESFAFLLFSTDTADPARG